MQRIRERSKVLWAILASLLVHVVVALSLATFGGAFAPATPVEEKPVELTIVDLSATPPPVAANPSFMETDESKRSAEPPKEKTFESNANSVAASKLPPTGRDPLPTQEGRELPFVQTETHPSSLASEGAKPQPTPPPPELKSTPEPSPSATPTPKASETPRTTPTPVPVSTPEPEQFAMLTATPPPPLREPEDGDYAGSGHRRIHADAFASSATRTACVFLSSAERTNAHQRPDRKKRRLLSRRRGDAARPLQEAGLGCDRLALVFLYEEEDSTW